MLSPVELMMVLMESIVFSYCFQPADMGAIVRPRRAFSIELASFPATSNPMILFRKLFRKLFSACIILSNGVRLNAFLMMFPTPLNAVFILLMPWVILSSFIFFETSLIASKPLPTPSMLQLCFSCSSVLSVCCAPLSKFLLSKYIATIRSSISRLIRQPPSILHLRFE